jgi:hypothetical protein
MERMTQREIPCARKRGYAGEMNFSRLALLGFLAACSSSPPTNFAGDYSVQLVDGANDCNFANWTAGSTSNVKITMTQDGSTAQFTVDDAIVAAYLNLVIGASTFSGGVKDDTFSASFLGVKTATQGACSYTINTKLAMTLDSNNVLSGTLTYTPATNADASCGPLNTCSQMQTVSGSRTSP